MEPARRSPESRSATAADLLALPEDAAAEVVGGEIVEKASPGFDHGAAHILIAGALARFHRRSGGDGPGGWWLALEVDVELAPHEIYRPDVVGWRRERLPERPRERPVRVRPDWVCEILSPSNARTDLVAKLRTYHRTGVPHYWIVDPQHETLTVLRHTPDGYLYVLTASVGDVVRAEPFDAIEIRVGVFFGAEED